MPAVDPVERRLQSKLAAHASWAATPDPATRTLPARQALEARFLEQAGGDPIRAEHLRQAFFTRLALKSVQSRRRAKEATAAAEAAETVLASLDSDPNEVA